jgi:hypothetical protein
MTEFLRSLPPAATQLGLAELGRQCQSFSAVSPLCTKKAAASFDAAASFG